MNAYRVATTLDARGELHVPDVPFEPGAEVEVIVLEGSASPRASRSTKALSLRDRQYELAREYPGEYVVLVGEQLVHHGPDRQAAARAYDLAAKQSSSDRPVIVRPGGRARRPPVLRGRSLAGRLGKTG